MAFDASAALEGIVGGAAKIKNAFDLVVGSVTPFVQAFDPGLIELFNRSMSNLQATVGAAFEPLIEILNNLAQQANDVMAGVFEDLRPVIEELSRAAGERLLPVIKLVAEVAQALVPLFALIVEAGRPLAELLPALANVLRAVTAIVTGLLSGVGGVLGAMKDFNDQFVAALKQATRALIVFIAQLAKMFGLDSVVESLRKTFGPQGAQKGKVAGPTDSGVTDMSSILRDAQAAAFAAQGGGVKPVEDWLGDISGQLDRALDQQKSFEEQVARSVSRVLLALGMGDVPPTLKDILAKMTRVGVETPKGVLSALTAGLL
jgi:ABC-type transporter Mla subunit MlaD